MAIAAMIISVSQYAASFRFASRLGFEYGLTVSFTVEFAPQMFVAVTVQLVPVSDVFDT